MPCHPANSSIEEVREPRCQDAGSACAHPVDSRRRQRPTKCRSAEEPTTTGESSRMKRRNEPSGMPLPASRSFHRLEQAVWGAVECFRSPRERNGMI